MKKTVFLLLLATCILLSGCSSPKRLSDYTIVQALAIERKGDGVKVTVQYLNFNKGSGKTEALANRLTATASASGKSIIKALKKVKKTVSGELFFGQNKLIVIDSALSGSEELGRFFTSRDYCRADMLTAYCDSPGKAVKNPCRSARVPADVLCAQIEAAHAAVTVSDYLAGVRDLPEISVSKSYCTIVK